MAEKDPRQSPDPLGVVFSAIQRNRGRDLSERVYDPEIDAEVPLMVAELRSAFAAIKSAREKEEIELGHASLEVFRDDSLEREELPLDAIDTGDVVTLWFGTGESAYGGMLPDREVQLVRVGPGRDSFLAVHDSLFERRDGFSEHSLPPFDIATIEGSLDAWDERATSSLTQPSLRRGLPVVFTHDGNTLPTSSRELVRMGLFQIQIQRKGLEPAYMFPGDEFDRRAETIPEVRFIGKE